MYRSCSLFVLAIALMALGCKPSANSNPVVDSGNNGSGLTQPTAESTDGVPIQNWAQFRGPSMVAADPAAVVPINWNAENCVVWKSKVIDGADSRGASSPIIVGDRVFLTAFTGCGTSPANRETISDLQHHVVCLDKQNGNPVWKRAIRGSYANKRLSEHALGHGYASSTPVSDGESLFTFFGISGVYAFDMDGNLLWQANVGRKSYDFGSSASLSIFEDLLFVNASVENETLYALDKKTGNAVWKFDRVIQSWCSPVVAENEAGEQELILNQTDTVHGLDPRTGEELWRCEGIHDYVVPTPLVVDGVCYITGGKEPRTMAIKLGGRGDVTSTHKLWEVRKGSGVSSPVLHDGVLYVVTDSGIMRCFDATTGEILSDHRLGVSNRVLASPTVLGDHMFIPTQDKDVLAMSLNNGCEIVAKNRLETNEVLFQASIAVSQNRMLLRSDDAIYCVGQADGQAQTESKTAATPPSDVIMPAAKYDVDENTGRPKTFVRCFVPEPDGILSFMLSPYKSVITAEQTAKSTEFILANHQPFLDLRTQYLDLTWAFRQGRKTEVEFTTALAEIEKQTMAQNYKVRKFIKDMFSKAQMDQHLREAAERAKKKAKK